MRTQRQHFQFTHGRVAGALARVVLLAFICAGGVQVACGQWSDADPRDLTDLSLEQLGKLQVTTAALHDENVADAPANITVITGDDIRRFGYRSLADVLEWVPGFYVSYDHTYTAIGVRGFSLAGDYGSRLILMVDGHSLADNIYDTSSWMGNDFPVEMDLIDHIEIARGSSSALYGSNGMLATINVITKKPSSVNESWVRIEAASLRQRKAEATTSVLLPHGAQLLLSTAVFNYAGAHQLYFNELDRPETNFGRAIDMDGEKGYHAFVDLTWGNWEMIAVSGDRVKYQPISWVDVVFNDRGTRAEDARGFLDIGYTRHLSGDRTLTWRTSYDTYTYRGTYRYRDVTVDDIRDRADGDWVGSQITYRMPDSSTGHITVGIDSHFDLRARQDIQQAVPVGMDYLHVNRLDRVAGAFAQQEWTLGRRWEINVGGRFDWSSLKRDAFSPRGAIIFRPGAKTNMKILFTRGFAHASTYEMFSEDDGLSQLPNPNLRPESVTSFEVRIERQLTRRVQAALSGFRYRIDDLIQELQTPGGLLQFANQDHVTVKGISAELTALFPRDLKFTASVDLQRALYGCGPRLANSPRQLGTARFVKSFWRELLTFTAGAHAMGNRRTYGGAVLPWFILPEAVVSSKTVRSGLELTAGVKNLSNTFYRDPIALTSTVDTVIGNGRTYFVAMTWHMARERQSRDRNIRVSQETQITK